MNSQAGWWGRLIGLPHAQRRQLSASTRAVSEVAFHELVAEEISRSERSKYSYRIVIVYVTESSGTVVAMENEVSRRVMAVLSDNLRMTDSVGWYRETLIIGAFLPVVGQGASVDQSYSIEKRLHQILRTQFAYVCGSIQVTVCGYKEACEFVTLQTG